LLQQSYYFLVLDNWTCIHYYVFFSDPVNRELRKKRFLRTFRSLVCILTQLLILISCGQNYASLYFSEISELLRRLPRVILLMLKTNDCLRAVNHALVSEIASNLVLCLFSFFQNKCLGSHIVLHIVKFIFFLQFSHCDSVMGPMCGEGAKGPKMLPRNFRHQAKILYV